MLQTKQLKLSVNAHEAWEQVPVDILSGTFAEHLDDAGIVSLRSLSKAYRMIFSDDDMWLDRLTLLSLRYPVLARPSSLRNDAATAGQPAPPLARTLTAI